MIAAKPLEERTRPLAAALLLEEIFPDQYSPTNATLCSVVRGPNSGSLFDCLKSPEHRLCLQNVGAMTDHGRSKSVQF